MFFFMVGTFCAACTTTDYPCSTLLLLFQFEQAISSQSYLMLTSAQFEDNGGEPPLKRSTYAHKAVMVSLGILFLIFGVLAAAIFSHLRQRKHRSVFAYSEFE